MSFDRLAPHYSRMERLLAGKTLQECRLAFLGEARGAQNILLIGEGHGRFLNEIVSVNSSARISCLDASAGMLEVARHRLNNRGVNLDRVKFIHKFALEWEPDERFDFIATQFFLDCFAEEELRTVILKIESLLEFGAKWLICDFQNADRGWRALRSRIVLSLAYSFFRYTTGLSARKIVPPQSFLAERGFVRTRRAEFNFRLLYAEMWEKRPAV
ncbi:MAG TPA: class I SAM-dependent methyltransferase [Verrucomicrobiae bacterium]|nr:class I SAM-dependent methyltransferase [Verrucomicrobiae bacterium]